MTRLRRFYDQRRMVTAKLFLLEDPPAARAHAYVALGVASEVDNLPPVVARRRIRVCIDHRQPQVVSRSRARVMVHKNDTMAADLAQSSPPRRVIPRCRSAACTVVDVVWAPAPVVSELPSCSVTRSGVCPVRGSFHIGRGPVRLTSGMSSTCPVTAISPASNFQLIFSTALKAYEKRTKTDLLAHPLASQLQACSSPGSILALLQDQADDLAQARRSDERLTKWLNPTVDVLLAFSATLGEGAAKDVSTAQEALVDIFERIENFFKRLETYTEVPPTAAMTDIIVKIMVEVLNILAIATKEIKKGRTKKYFNKLVGKTDIEDALRRLDKLTQDEVRMATAQLLKITHDVDDKVTKIDDDVKGVDDKVKRVDDKVNDVSHTVKLVLDGA
ncbi:hypothetical protein EDB92DRAFT_1811996 [Lactarius akahatsu]|uniref:Uncharacterized protein n=1 Tax=Lactarius akahatsu TaxID=416441 RepID=A0AAD4LV62_9AGAM|nr:hypothetical protein EDB92DRAFT_1811996 [Lactarius akahatsu]